MPGKVKGQVVRSGSWDTSYMITIGSMAKTYGLLPSEVAARATTFDIMITDVYSTWFEKQMNKSNGDRTEDYSQDELKAMIEKTKNVG